MAAFNLKEIENGIYELGHEESSKPDMPFYTCRNELLGLSAQQVQPKTYFSLRKKFG